jgi:hypothetical protein
VTVAKHFIAGWGVALMFCAGMPSATPQDAIASQPRPPRDSARKPSQEAPLFTPDLNREVEYRRTRPDQINPIQQLPVTRATYRKWLQFSGHLRYVDDPTGHGQYGPRHFLPVLAEYAESGDPRYGQACIEMLKAFHRWIEEEVARKGWHTLFCQEMGYIGLYREHLVRGGLIAADEKWLRNLVLDFARNLHPWDTPRTYWRGPMHRAQGEGVAKRLAAEWYPDAPEAEEWKAYSEKVYADWWRFRDFAANDTNYLFVTLQPLFLRATLLRDEQFFQDAAMANVWQRLMQEVSPDGAVPPYGANLGWNDTAGIRVAMLEMLASKTGDGRYRFVAHRLMNYLIYQRMRYRDNHMLLGPQSTEPLALAHLFADDAIEPVEPDSRSAVLVRKEAIRLPGFGGDPRDKILAEPVIGPVDGHQDRGFIDCGLLVGEATKPSKLVLRSGWNPGDFYAIIDLYPRHDPLNPLGILGMTRWGSSLTCAISAKARSEENRIIVTSNDRGAQPPGKNVQPETTISDFVDGQAVTYASVSVDGYDGLPVACTRHFVFVKNEFLFVRDVITASSPLDVTLASVFNTQNIGPRLSPNAALTYMNQPPALDVGLLNPPVDLLVYHCPLPDARIEVIDRTSLDPRAESVRGQLRYSWSGVLAENRPRHFAALFRPQSPTPAGQAVSSDPAADDDVGRLALDTSFIETLLHDGLATVLRIIGPEEREQWVVCNPEGRLQTTGDLQTDARAAYVEVRDGEPVTVWQHKGSQLTIRGRKLPASEGRNRGGSE